jgi:anaerobic glycerol-3-phosphate dehydrogenase
MPAIFDVAVIGGGIAGVSAALAAHQRGAKACVLRAAPGATALVSGAWNGPLRAELRTALAEAGYALDAAERPLAHERGPTTVCAYAGASHTRATPDARPLVCGFSGLPHFNASTLARIWNAGQPLATHTITLSDTPAAGWTTAALAASIEAQPQRVTENLPAHATHVIFPAVLGIERVQDVIAQLAARNVIAAEALAAAPSVPGWRLMQACDRVLAARGIPVVTGRARLQRAQAQLVADLRVGDDVISAHSFVLATGKYLSGGITAVQQFQESVFDLPIWLEHLGDVFTSFDPLPLTDAVRSESQPLLHAGVHTDALLRPVDRGGQPVFRNLYAAGTIRAEWSAPHAGLGNAAEDGWTAGMNATA